MRILKNPFAQNLQLRLQAKENATMKLQLADQLGRILLVKTVNVIRGANTITLPEANRLANGIYLLTINGDGFAQTVKIIKAD